MILRLKQWCEGIIIAIVISIIIEMLVPEGSNKKYVKVVIGIYIIFVTLSPILELINYDYNFENIFNFETIETTNESEEKIQQVYANGIEETIKSDIEKLGYIVSDINITFDSKYENIENIKLQVTKNGISSVEPVIIGQDSNTQENYDDIISFLEENYTIKRENINFGTLER